MRAATTTILTSGVRWYEWYPSVPISQHPTMWRFLAYGQFRGTASVGCSSTTTWQTGYGVFDWDYTKNRYELTWFDPTPDYWSYAPTFSNTAFTWVDNNVVRLVGSAVDDSISDTVRHAAKFSVSASGRFTWLQPNSTHCGNDLVSDADFYQGWAVGYNGGIIYPYADGKFTEPYPTQNIFIGKITDTNSATNLGPIRSGSDMRGAFGPLTSFGSTAAGNGYAFGVDNCTVDSISSTVYARVYNISNATPSIQYSLSYSGNSTNLGGIHIGARKVVYSQTGPSHLTNLLYTDSDTVPTTLTKGSSVSYPTLPFTPERVEMGYLAGGSFNAQNCWVSEGKSATVCPYVMTSADFVSGETYKNRYIPVKLLSSGTSDLSVSVLTTDVDGNPVPLQAMYSSNLQSISNYAFQVVGAPGDKAALFWRLGNAAINTNQSVFQL